jgi:alkyl sulfatase BDS1-like metallo-beta-lactamase superfamily hydrolase
MTIENLLDYLAVRVDSMKAQHTPFTLNIVIPDEKETYFVEMSNGNLNNILVDKEMKADATLLINRADVSQILLEKTTLKTLLENGSAGIKGDKTVLQKLTGSLTNADAKFEIVPRPKKGEEVDAELYETAHKH